MTAMLTFSRNFAIIWGPLGLICILFCAPRPSHSLAFQLFRRLPSTIASTGTRVVLLVVYQRPLKSLECAAKYNVSESEILRRQ
eukprot:COSAG01_NODE_851_length_13121_cov_49.974044_13_plen_84_part_00